MNRLLGERRAVAAAVLAFYGMIYLLFALSGQVPPLTNALFGLAGVYILGFFALSAGYFWARWYAIGVGLFGLISGLVAIWQIGLENVVLFMAGSHALVALGLWGDGMSKAFDGRLEWRTRFHLDEHAVHRLGKAVIRIGISLPYILLYALAPKGASESLLAVAALGLAGAGAYGLIRLRTWGLASLVGAAAVLAIGALTSSSTASAPALLDPRMYAVIGAALLGAAVVPFGRPVLDYLRSR